MSSIRRSREAPATAPIGGPSGVSPQGRAAARTRQSQGSQGEDAACAMLQRLGYVVLERNLRAGGGEADIVALTPAGSVAVVEVKARRGPWHGEERVNADKRGHLLRLAAVLSCQPRFARRMFQFDVVAVQLGPQGEPVDLAHFPHAFDASGSCW